VKFITTVRQQRNLKNKKMKRKNIITALALVSIIFIVGCKKDNNEPQPSNPSASAQTVPLQSTSQAPVAMGANATLAILAGSAISNTGATHITGDMGLSPGTSIGGFPPGILVGTQHINDAIATQAKLDLTAAYNDAAGRTATDIVTLSGNIGGMTLTPGLYKSTSSLAVSSGDVTFDGKGNVNSVFIIQIASTLTTTAGRKVFLTNGASAANIFWQVGTSATFGTTSVFKGTILAMQSITFNTGATLNGRALARTGAIVMAGNAITVN